MSEDTSVRIGELAAASGVSTRALRYYEEHGLLAAQRSPAGQRYYTPDAVERVRWIQTLFAAGLSSRTLVELLPCVHSGFATADMVHLLERQRDHVEEQVRELTTARDRLNEVITEARASGTVSSREMVEAG